MRRLAPVLVIAFLISSDSYAGQKRRAVIHAIGEATLTASVADLVTNKPVLSVEVAGPGVFARSDRAGNFSMSLPVGQPVELTFSRSGYKPLVQTVTIQNDTTMAFRVESRPTVRITTRAGTVFEVDEETFEFGYAEFFLGYRRDRKAEMCEQGGPAFTLDRDDLRRIRGPSFSSIDPACCPTGTPAGLEFDLTDDRTVRAYFLDTCLGRKIELIATDHVAYLLVFVPIGDVEEVVFP